MKPQRIQLKRSKGFRLPEGKERHSMSEIQPSKSVSQMSAMELMDVHSKAQQAQIERLTESLDANITVSKARDAEIQRLRGALIRARDLLRRAGAEEFVQYEFNTYLGDPENAVAPESPAETAP